MAFSLTYSFLFLVIIGMFTSPSLSYCPSSTSRNLKATETNNNYQKNSSYKSITVPELKKILTSCPNHMYLDVKSKQCVKSCPENNFVFNNLCVSTCPPEKPVIEASSNICLSNCPKDKLVYIVNDVYVCVDSCPQGYNFVYGQQCVESCPPNTWIDTSSMKCLSGCPTHLPYRMNSVCMHSCPYPMLYDGIYCKNSCMSNQFQNGRNCTSECPNDKVYDGRICRDSCHGKLLEIVGTVGGRHAKVCVKNCSASKPLLFGQECVASCPSGTVQYNGACLYGCPPIAPKHSNGFCVNI